MIDRRADLTQAESDRLTMGYGGVLNGCEQAGTDKE